ncbi:MAG: cell division protein FtsZ [Pseudomonadota bacterium]
MATFELAGTHNEQAVIKVIGVGGGGGNAVDHMANSSLDCVEFVCANTDAQALANNTAKTVIQLGNEMTKGLGAGANPDTGREAAIEDRDLIMETIEGSDMLFITAGMGGGTGTGAAPIVAEIAKEMGILTVAVVTKPFPWEGKRRMEAAEKGIEELREYVDSLITIPNEKLQSVLGKGTTLLDAFKEANNVLLNAVQGISELITRRGLINVDFADVRAVMSNMGTAMMGTGSAVGEDRAREAAERAISSPLLDDVNMAGAKGILVNITAGMDLGIGEFEEVGEAINKIASDDAIVVVGTVIEPEMSGEMRVTIVATGIGRATDIADAEIKLVSSKTTKREELIQANELSDLEHVMPQKQVVGGDIIVNNEPADMTYLDIPAFLRRQND